MRRAVGLSMDDVLRLVRHDERVRLFGCSHTCRVELGDAWLCFDCGLQVGRLVGSAG